MYLLHLNYLALCIFMIIGTIKVEYTSLVTDDVHRLSVLGLSWDF